MKAIKYDQNKPRVDLIPAKVLLKLGEVFLHGAKKYTKGNVLGDYNYFRGEGLRPEQLYGAAQRHALKWWAGEDIDVDSGLNHLDQAIAELMMLRDLDLNKKPIIDGRQGTRP